MKIEATINGNKYTGESNDPRQALEEFYYAFNHRDLSILEKNWLISDDIRLANPLGGIKRGWESIKQVYETIFNSNKQVYVEYYDVDIHMTNEIFFSVGRERGFAQSGNDRVDLAIRTSRVYRKHQGIWRQIHHHGSIDDSTTLSLYQQLIHS